MLKGGKRKKPMVIILIVVGVLLVAGIGVFAKIQYEQSKMRPLKTQEIISGVFAVNNNFVNFFLIESNGKYIAIDAGNNNTKTKNEMQNLGISPDDIIAVFLTHTHGDHITALSLFTHAAVYVGEGTTLRNTAYATMSDGETVNILNASIQCIFTPGHMKNSVSYVADGKYLFAGDNLSLRDNHVALFNSFYNNSNEIQAESIKKLAVLEGIQYIITAHYGFTTHYSLL
ncbi:MAG: MBL fold metallo-hydrolase [Oscillospiraceae bacterium]|nr:MBL fold metallo-hydrolase [Oscillospiraceae bacterium]